MNNCQAGHLIHSHRTVMTDVGSMVVYDWEQYMDFEGFCTGQDDVSMTLCQTGTWDKPIKELIERLTFGRQEKGMFIDVGSHVGYFSRLAANYHMPVMAYEAESESVAILRENVPTADAHQIWFDEKTEQAIFNPYLKVDIMKLDIEGSEQYAIRYFWHMILNDQIENIIMEVSPTFNDSYPELLRQLERQGYTIRELSGEHFNWNFNFAQTNLWLHL